MADKYPGPDDILARLSTPKAPGRETLTQGNPADGDVLAQLSAPRAPGRAPVLTTGVVTRKDVKGA